MTFVRTTTRWFLPALAALFLFAACSDELPTECPNYEVGAVEGYVTSAGVPYEVDVQALEVRTGGQWLFFGSEVATVATDSNGWYRLDLPTGLYGIIIDHPGLGRSGVFDPGDTIRVDTDVTRFDMALGTARIDLTMPAELEARAVTLRLDPVSGNSVGASTEVVAGHAEFEVTGLAPGPYLVGVDLAGTFGRVFLPGVLDAAAAETLVVGTEAVAEITADFTASYASISGQVTGSWQETDGVAMQVWAYSSTSRIHAQGVADREDGSFTIDLLVPRPVRLATIFGHYYNWYGGQGYSTAQAFEPQPGDRISGVDIVVCGFRAWLTGPGFWTRHRCTVTLQGENGDIYQDDFSQYNPITLANLDPGRYYLHLGSDCGDQPWQSQWYPGVVDFSDAVPIDLTGGELVELDFDLVPGGRIAGRISEADGNVPGTLTFVLYDGEGQPVCDDGNGVRDGVFDFPGLPDGDYYLAVRLDADEFWWYPGTPYIVEGTLFHVEDAAEFTDLEWSLPDLEVQP